MTEGYPQYSRPAQQGERGVNIVSSVVNEKFGWLFKRNHQEHDFGIDGQIEVVTDKGHVSGQMLSVQIKCGKSFFEEKNRWGYVFRGNKKHFNYLSNYPIPVLVIICDPESEMCYWARFLPEQTTPTDAGWKITIPFENKFSKAKNEIHAMLPPMKDSLSDLQEYWVFNEMIAASPYIHFVVGRYEIEHIDTARPRNFFDRLRSTKELAHRCQGKVEISFHGYDDDFRELFEIDEVRNYVSKLDAALRELFFFARTEEPHFMLKLFALCQADVEWVDGRSTATVKRTVTFDNRNLWEFLNRHWPGLNEMTEWLSMTLEENKKISSDVMRCFGIEPSDNT